MLLTDEQKQTVAAWIEDGAKPADVQQRLETEFGLRVTYMEVRFLMDDLKLMPKDPVPPPAPVEPAPEPAAAADGPLLPSEEPAPGGGGVKIKVDELVRPGALVSGRVTFSDGKTGEWYLDQMGRLGMVPPEPGYRPAQQDVTDFQVALEKELVKLGM